MEPLRSLYGIKMRSTTPDRAFSEDAKRFYDNWYQPDVTMLLAEIERLKGGLEEIAALQTVPPKMSMFIRESDCNKALGLYTAAQIARKYLEG